MIIHTFYYAQYGVYNNSVKQNNEPHQVKSVDRALLLLTLLRDRGEISVTEAAEVIGVAPSTAHRLLTTLSGRGWAVQRRGRLYQPGPEFLAPLSHSSSVASIRQMLQPYLISLYEEVQETVHLILLEGRYAHFIDGLESPNSLRVGLRLGARLPAFVTSGGKAMLSELSSADLASLYRSGLQSWPTRKTRNLAELEIELAEARARGFGLNRDESEGGITALGASLGTPAGEIKAALVVAIPTVRFTKLEAERITASLLRVCAESRRSLSYNE